MLSHQEIYEVLVRLIGSVNKKGVAVTPATSFANDLEFDSLTVMDMVAAIEDEFDITLPLNMLPVLETVDQVATAVEKILKDRDNG